MDIGKFDRR